MSDDTTISLEDAGDQTRTGDLWLFRGRSVADRAIRMLSNAPVNHVGMAVVLDDLPPLMWHAELGKGLLDLYTGTHHRGVQLHDLRAAVEQWAGRYEQQVWLRQLTADIDRTGRWVRGRVRSKAGIEQVYCAEVVAATYQEMGLLDDERPTNYYDPGRFWSGDHLTLQDGAVLGSEVRVVG